MSDAECDERLYISSCKPQYEVRLHEVKDDLFERLSVLSIALYVTAYQLHLPAHYAWIAVVAVYGTAPVIFWLRWKSGKWRKHVLDKEELDA